MSENCLTHWLTLTAEGSNVENATALYHAVKQLSVEELQLDLPALPRVGRARGTRPPQTASQHVTDGHTVTFYAVLYQTHSRTGGSKCT